VKPFKGDFYSLETNCFIRQYVPTANLKKTTTTITTTTSTVAEVIHGKTTRDFHGMTCQNENIKSSLLDGLKRVFFLLK
jgi:hypothetical protein